MRVLILTILLTGLQFMCCAQQDEDVKTFIARVGWQQGDTNFWDKITINQILALPSEYKVMACELVYANKGEIYRIPYSDRFNSGKDSNLEKYRIYSLPWILNRITSGNAKGEGFIVDNIQVRKGDKTLKLKSKAIIVK